MIDSSLRLRFDKATAKKYAWDRFCRVTGMPQKVKKKQVPKVICDVAWQAFSFAYDDGYYQGKVDALKAAAKEAP